MNEAEEITHLDHISPPYTVHVNQWGDLDIPIAVTSIGRFHEGTYFNQFLHGFDNYSLTLTLSGSAEKIFRSTTRTINRGDVFFTSGYESSSLHTVGSQWNTMFINMRGYDLKLYEDLWNCGGFEIIHIDNTEFFENAFQKIDSLICLPDITSRLKVSSLISELISRLLIEKEKSTQAETNDSPVWLQDAKKYISTHCTENIRIEDVADLFYVNRSAFSRLFKKHTGKSPKEFQVYCRVDSAAILLRTTDKNVSEIAFETGFTSHSFFSEQFSQIYGTTPSEWRKVKITKNI